MAKAPAQSNDFDLTILLLAVVLSCLGVVMVYSSSAVMASERFSDGFFFLKRQGVFLVFGFLVMMAAMYCDYRFLHRLAMPLLLVCLGMLALVLIPGVGHTVNGASRWFRLPGFSIQPSELAKIALVIYLAHSLAKKKDKVTSLFWGFFPYVLVLGALLVLIVMEPDLGSAVVIAAVGVTMMLVAGVKCRYLFVMAMLLAPTLYLFIVKVPYRRQRLLAFLNPWESPDRSGYHIIQSQIAFDSGGLWGQGLGQGLQKLFFLPEAHTDFIFSVLGEELGFVGVLVVAGMFLLLVVLGFRVALNAVDEFGCYLAFGLTLLLGLEAFLNIAVVLGMLPPKGMALPFVSYGGTSLLCSLLAVGMLLSVSRFCGQEKG